MAKRPLVICDVEGYEATLLDYQTKIHEYSSIYDTIPRLMAWTSAVMKAPGSAIGDEQGCGSLTLVGRDRRRSRQGGGT